MPTNSPPVTRLAWIKRRARRLACAFGITRRDALANAWQDWTHLYPNTQGAARHIEHA
jgi:hypothetical protein